MRTIKILLSAAIFFVGFASNAQTTKNPEKSATPQKIEAYYFHFTSRCITCKTVEAEAKTDIEALYPEQVMKGLISFQAINLDDSSSKVIAKKLQVSGQSLLIVKGEQKINITNEGFLYARSNPEKFKTIIKEKIDGLL
jgi:hypothetical protein